MAEWNMEKQRLKKVKIPGLDDKLQITAVFAAAISGEFLVPQLVYKGMTWACLPTMRFPDSWYITYTDDHWCNETTMKLYIEKIIVLYIQRKKAEQNLPSSQRALCIMDGWISSTVYKQYSKAVGSPCHRHCTYMFLQTALVNYSHSTWVLNQ